MKRSYLVSFFVGVILCLGVFPAFMAAEEKHSISLETSPQVQILQIDYYMKVHKRFGEGKPALFVEVTIRNSSAKAERFSVMVTTPDGTSAAGFIPAKAKKGATLPVLEPKEEGKITIPLLTEKIPNSFSMEVESVPAE